MKTKEILIQEALIEMTQAISVGGRAIPSCLKTVMEEAYEMGRYSVNHGGAPKGFSDSLRKRGIL